MAGLASRRPACSRSGWRQESGSAVRRVLLPRWQEATDLLDTRCLIESLIARSAPFSGGLTGQVLAGHQRLASAVVGGDADGAASVARPYFTMTRQALRAILDRSLEETTGPGNGDAPSG
jgi:DNA-binding GntR family transcriptional regulator